MGILGKTVFILWLLWVHVFFYRNLLVKYGDALGDIGLGGASGLILSVANKLLSIIGLS
ncbi:MAG: hypothetical protein P9M00_04410 [Candidatus Tritonobacter lacicola]|nr:hypothetical protein [Candidatus Tritonobacter lacicola]